MAEIGTSTTAGATAGTLISPGLGTAIGAGIGALGNLTGSWLSGKSAKKAAAQANALAIWQQKQAQKWQEYMSNTAHQREVKDLKAAGLNPVLSANSGASAGSVGIGNTPAYESTDYTSAAKGAAEGFEKALSLKAMENQTKTTDADADLKGKQGTLAETETKVAKQTEAIKGLEKDILEANKEEIIETNKATKAAERAEAKARKGIADIDIENQNSSLWRFAKGFSDISNLLIGPMAQMVQMAGTASKVAALKQMSRKVTKERYYDRDGKYSLLERELE